MRLTFRESSIFYKEAQRLLGDDRLRDLQIHLSTRPDAGAPIPGGRGLRKVRWSMAARGKRGGARVIYFHWVSDSVIELVFVYAKNETADLTKPQVKQLADMLGI